MYIKLQNSWDTFRLRRARDTDDHSSFILYGNIVLTGCGREEDDAGEEDGDSSSVRAHRAGWRAGGRRQQLGTRAARSRRDSTAARRGARSPSPHTPHFRYLDQHST